VKIVERVVEKVVVRQDPECLKNLEQARQLIAAASDRLMLQPTEVEAPIVLAPASVVNSFPTMAEMERAMILAAYQRSNRSPLEAARLLGIGKTTLYRKLREIGQVAA
jgi:transcriptional regulator of acetoin/glycerol metabolism